MPEKIICHPLTLQLLPRFYSLLLSCPLSISLPLSFPLTPSLSLPFGSHIQSMIPNVRVRRANIPFHELMYCAVCTRWRYLFSLFRIENRMRRHISPNETKSWYGAFVSVHIEGGFVVCRLYRKVPTAEGTLRFPWRSVASARLRVCVWESVLTRYEQRACVVLRKAWVQQTGWEYRKAPEWRVFSLVWIVDGNGSEHPNTARFPNYFWWIFETDWERESERERATLAFSVFRVRPNQRNSNHSSKVKYVRSGPNRISRLIFILRYRLMQC